MRTFCCWKSPENQAECLVSLKQQTRVVWIIKLLGMMALNGKSFFTSFRMTFFCYVFFLPLLPVVWFKVSRFMCLVSLHTYCINAFLGYFHVVLRWSIIMEIVQKKFRGRCIHSVCRHDKASPYLLLHHHLCFSMAHSTTSNLSFIWKCNFTLWLRIS